MALLDLAQNIKIKDIPAAVNAINAKLVDDGAKLTASRRLVVPGSIIASGSGAATPVDGELLWDATAHQYKYYSSADSQWHSITGGPITYTGTLWTQAGSDIAYSAGNVTVGGGAAANTLAARAGAIQGSAAIFDVTGSGGTTHYLTVTSTGAASIGVDLLLADASSLTGHLNALVASGQQTLSTLGMIAPGILRSRDDGSGGVILPTAVRIDGQAVLGLPEAAPNDASIPNGHCAIWLNAGTLTFRIRNLAGTLSTKTL